MLVIQLLNEVELRALPLVADGRGRGEVQDRRRAFAELRSLKRGGHEAGAPVAAPAGRLVQMIEHHDIARQIGVFAAEAVSRPGAEAGPAAEDAAGVHLADAADVIEAIGPATAEDAEVVGTGRD